MNPQMTFQRVCAVAGLICPLLFFGAFIAAGFIPPLAPSASAAQIAAHYPRAMPPASASVRA